MSSTLFYARLPLLTEFDDVGRQESYTPLPDDWHVVMCDVRKRGLASSDVGTAPCFSYQQRAAWKADFERA